MSNNTSKNYQPDQYKYVCEWPTCMRVFTCPHNVQQHVREKHTNERPYKCTQCPAAFPRPFGLNRHMKIHDRKVGPGKRTYRKRKRDDDETEEPTTQNQAPMGYGMGAQAAPSPYPPGLNGGSTKRRKKPVDSAPDLTNDAPPPPGYVAADASSSSSDAQNSTFDDRPDVTAENFILRPSDCHLCRATFDMQEGLIAHFHDAHSMPNNPACSCIVCKGMFKMPDARTIDPQLMELSQDRHPLQNFASPNEEYHYQDNDFFDLPGNNREINPKSGGDVSMNNGKDAADALGDQGFHGQPGMYPDDDFANPSAYMYTDPDEGLDEWLKDAQHVFGD